MQLKKFRVTKADGEIVIIDAQNIENAISIARSQFGQLPNDINEKIAIDLLTEFSNLGKLLNEASVSIKKGNRDLDWETVYRASKRISEAFKVSEDKINTLAGSLVKIDKENNEHESI